MRGMRGLGRKWYRDSRRYAARVSGGRKGGRVSGGVAPASGCLLGLWLFIVGLLR